MTARSKTRAFQPCARRVAFLGQSMWSGARVSVSCGPSFLHTFRWAGCQFCAEVRESAKFACSCFQRRVGWRRTLAKYPCRLVLAGEAAPPSRKISVEDLADILESHGELDKNSDLMWTRRRKVCSILIFCVITWCTSLVLRFFFFGEYSASLLHFVIFGSGYRPWPLVRNRQNTRCFV